MCSTPCRRASISTPRLYEPEELSGLDTRNWLIVHVAQADAFAQAHLPEARLVTPRELVLGSPPAPGRLPPVAQLEAMFCRIGYRPDQHIVTYDDEGGGWAGRFGWTLDVIGHRNWGYINGGVHAMHACRVGLVAGPPVPVVPTSVRITLHHEPIAEIADILATLGSPDHVVLDVRTAEEYAGVRAASARSGHIPGAVNIDWMRMQDPARATRLVTNIAQLLESHGITPDKHVITHCQTHHRSGLSYLVMRLLGYPHVQAYHGSWSEWGNRDDTPIEL